MPDPNTQFLSEALLRHFEGSEERRASRDNSAVEGDEGMDNVEQAANSVARELKLFASTVTDYREDYFHTCNRDEWVCSFCEWLLEKQRRSALVRASND